MAPRADCFFRVLKTLFLFLALQSNLSSCLYQLSPGDVEMILQDACIVAGVLPLDETVVAALVSLERAFRYEGGVVVGVIQADFRWDTGEKLRWADERKLPGERKDVAFFPRTAEDRNCLILPPKVKPRAHIYTESRSPEVMLEFINQNCNTYRTLEGDVSFQGLHRDAILENIFRVADVSSFTMGVKFGLTNTTEQCSVNSTSYTGPTEAETCGLYDGVQSHEEFRTVGEFETSESVTLHVENGARERSESPSSGKQKVSDRMAECERIPVASRAEFFHNYVKRSRPIIITGAMEQWNVFEKWSNDFLRERFGKEEVHIKLTPGGEYEGVEEASLWEDFGTFQIPRHVKDQLMFPDLVVVRPATLNLKFGKFLDMIEETARSEVKNISAYLEYSSIPQYMPSLEADIPGFPFVNSLLTRRHLNMWLSDGNTLGKLHFDPFDNLLCQISGKKAVILFEPHDNSKLYEAHIPEAILGYNNRTGTFRRKTLLDSTSMVMSPVDILKPNFKRFPQFAAALPVNCTIEEGEVLYMPAHWWHRYSTRFPQFAAALPVNCTIEEGERFPQFAAALPVNCTIEEGERFPQFAAALPVNCTIEEGDVLYMPAHWWHEVQSYPSSSQHRNLAINFWYEPFLTKEFPCQTCSLDVNPHYRHLLG
ncbi:PREDICTED: uncharacterized protein LOC109471344 [Branchiostoma belcheri]|uniref:Uncharacterized protein LOC109471344 n=1 Tax=Branchiostoma belcheri TaxID=7741 RepID=A0A6P4Z531_BRABE|nr:PREDICTED: uncharacterized protein LOC109471344 [Branchiostoma belcheri]